MRGSRERLCFGLLDGGPEKVALAYTLLAKTKLINHHPVRTEEERLAPLSASGEPESISRQPSGSMPRGNRFARQRFGLETFTNR